MKTSFDQNAKCGNILRYEYTFENLHGNKWMGKTVVEEVNAYEAYGTVLRCKVWSGIGMVRSAKMGQDQIWGCSVPVFRTSTDMIKRNKVGLRVYGGRE